MATDVHPVALVLHRARNAADVIRGLEHQRLHAAVAHQFQRRREACRAGTDDDY